MARARSRIWQTRIEIQVDSTPFRAPEPSRWPLTSPDEACLRRFASNAATLAQGGQRFFEAAREVPAPAAAEDAQGVLLAWVVGVESLVAEEEAGAGSLGN